ncbi:hypothetical protein RSAG8_12746, partial [Rhizoctonia solani AG-8 WAC10335]
MEECLAKVTIGNSHSKKLTLGVVSMSYPVILGFDWLWLHNPSIDWESGTLTLSCCHMDTSGLLLVHSVDPNPSITSTICPGPSLGSHPIPPTHIASEEALAVSPADIETIALHLSEAKTIEAARTHEEEIEQYDHDLGETFGLNNPGPETAPAS